MSYDYSTQWLDYEIIDCGDGRKIERYGSIILDRPDPLATGSLSYTGPIDSKYDNKTWSQSIEDTVITYKDMKFEVSPTLSKHTGIFPEQAANWDFIRSSCKAYGKPIRVLNLFGYTGAASVASAMQDNVIEVVHIDALKQVLKKTQTNIKLNNLDHKTVRTIQEDVLKFITREIKRGRKYEGIIMDPPSYGKGPNNEKWTINELLPQLLSGISQLLSDDPCFVVVNTYSTNLSGDSVLDMLKGYLPYSKYYSSVQLGLPITQKSTYLKAGYAARWCFNEYII